MIDFIVANPFRQLYMEHPVFGAMDCVTAHSDGYSSQCSCTPDIPHTHAFRRKISFDLFITLSFQGLEPLKIQDNSVFNFQMSLNLHLSFYLD